ncbi:MAG TPA: Stp1/IreP family PP2C-type Ser/Thr phosphatase [Actinomycetota bacterium]|jgi:protein phosphatase|nr:Stp1/IreP family PP2C-type Ser/Thr phosphatase [Actinomycetota bacterium]
MRIVAGVATDTGRVRDHNEDAYIVEPPLYAIADGMGGANAGEVASQLALETIGEMQRAGETTLDDEVREANRVVFARSGEDAKFAGMGTTVTAALASADALHLVHVGDSRAYLLRAGSLRQLTRDHTLVDRMVQAGEISRDEADVHPHRNVLIRALGTEPKVDVEALDLGLLEGDQVLLCSDGLHDMVTESQISAILDIARGAPQDAADRLVRSANRAGGIDNITAIVLEVEPGEPEVGTVADGPTASELSTRRVPWRAITVVLATIVLLLVAYTVFRSYLERQWYLGVSDGHVALYQGIPAEPFGIHLSHVDLDTGIDVTAIAKFPSYQGLNEGITYTSRDSALQTVAQMRADLRKQQQHQQQQQHHNKKNGGGGGQ